MLVRMIVDATTIGAASFIKSSDKVRDPAM